MEYWSSRAVKDWGDTMATKKNEQSRRGIKVKSDIKAGRDVASGKQTGRRIHDTVK
jgi:hypothetical protein